MSNNNGRCLRQYQLRQRSKGNGVKIPNDLVTVIEERCTVLRNAKPLSDREGMYIVLIHKSGNLPFIGAMVTRY